MADGTIIAALNFYDYCQLTQVGLRKLRAFVLRRRRSFEPSVRFVAGWWVFNISDDETRHLTYGLSIRSNDCRFCLGWKFRSQWVCNPSFLVLLYEIQNVHGNTEKQPTVTLISLHEVGDRSFARRILFREPRDSKPDLHRQLLVACPVKIVQIYVSIALLCNSDRNW